jgi:hypothetical protein
MVGGEYETRDDWDYTCHHLLLNLENKRKSDISKTAFYKLLCIADRVLRTDFDTDIKLPCYWYQYGEVVDPEAIGGNTINIEPAEWDGERVEPTRNIAEHEFDITDELKETIFKATKSVAARFSDSNSNDIQSYQYQHYAPTEFIRTFDEFRTSISEPNHRLSDFYVESNSRSQNETVGAKLEDMLSVYPTSEYDEMYDVFLRWEDTSQLLLENNRYSDLKLFSKSFWETFCKVETRLHHNRGIPSKRTAKWIRARDHVKNEFKQELSNQREELLDNRAVSSVYKAATNSE